MNKPAQNSQRQGMHQSLEKHNPFLGSCSDCIQHAIMKLLGSRSNWTNLVLWFLVFTEASFVILMKIRVAVETHSNHSLESLVARTTNTKKSKSPPAKILETKKTLFFVPASIGCNICCPRQCLFKPVSSPGNAYLGLSMP